MACKMKEGWLGSGLEAQDLAGRGRPAPAQYWLGMGSEPGPRMGQDELKPAQMEKSGKEQVLSTFQGSVEKPEIQ